MLSICRTASRAPRAPSSASASSRVFRERTSAYSAITKNALTRTSSPVRMMNSAFTGTPAPATPATGRPHQRPAWGKAPSALGSPSSVSCYFGMDRRRSCSDGGTVAAAPPRLARATLRRRGRAPAKGCARSAALLPLTADGAARRGRSPRQGLRVVDQAIGLPDEEEGLPTGHRRPAALGGLDHRLDLTHQRGPLALAGLEL